MFAKYALIAAVALVAPSALAGEAKYETRQVWNGRGFVTYFVGKPVSTGDQPHTLTGRPDQAAKPVRYEMLRVGSRIVAVHPVAAR